MRILLLAACLPLLPTLALCQTQPVDIGVNVGGVSDFAVQSFFVDAMKQSRHWGTPGTPWDQAAAVDAQGWPTQDAGSVILCCLGDAAGHSVIAGTYQLSFQGIAAVAFTVAGSGTVFGMSYDAATNTSTAQVSLADNGAGSSIILSFTSTQRSAASAVGTGVTAVSLIRPRMAPNGRPWWTGPGQVFTTPYLDLLRRFSTLRFMDFTATNGVTLTSWSQRTTPQMATQQATQGAAWEYAILLANTLHKDMWVNIPDQADSDYVMQLATLLHGKLDPSLHVWLEYSNEVWNYSFGQAGRNQAAAEAEVAANPASPLAIGCADYQSCRYEWGERRIGLQVLQDGQVFRSVFGNAAGQVRPVFATQLGQTYFVSLVFSMIQSAFGAPANYLYAIAQAPYWTGDNSLDGLTQKQELTNAAANLASLAQPEHDFAVWATQYGVRSVTYEGGPGMSGTASLAAKIGANRSPQMGTLVRQSLRQAVSSGIGLYMYYDDAGSYGQYGMWGLTEDVLDLATPKMAALDAVRRDGFETLNTGTKLPATIDATHPDLCQGGEYTEPGYLYLSQAASCGFLINVPSTATYALTLTVGNYNAPTTGHLAGGPGQRRQLHRADLAGWQFHELLDHRCRVGDADPRIAYSEHRRQRRRLRRKRALSQRQLTGVRGLRPQRGPGAAPLAFRPRISAHRYTKIRPTRRPIEPPMKRRRITPYPRHDPPLPAGAARVGKQHGHRQPSRLVRAEERGAQQGRRQLSVELVEPPPRGAQRIVRRGRSIPIEPGLVEQRGGRELPAFVHRRARGIGLRPHGAGDRTRIEAHAGFGQRSGGMAERIGCDGIQHSGERAGLDARQQHALREIGRTRPCQHERAPAAFGQHHLAAGKRHDAGAARPRRRRLERAVRDRGGFPRQHEVRGRGLDRLHSSRAARPG